MGSHTVISVPISTMSETCLYFYCDLYRGGDGDPRSGWLCLERVISTRQLTEAGVGVLQFYVCGVFQ